MLYLSTQLRPGQREDRTLLDVGSILVSRRYVAGPARLGPSLLLYGGLSESSFRLRERALSRETGLEMASRCYMQTFPIIISVP